MTETCRATKADGSRCLVEFGLNDDGLCRAHAEGGAELMASIGAKGGAATREAWRPGDDPPEGMPEKPPETLADCVKWASWLSWAVASGNLDTKRGQIVATGLRELRESLRLEGVETEVRELRQLVKELDARNKELTGRRGRR